MQKLGWMKHTGIAASWMLVGVLAAGLFSTHAQVGQTPIQPVGPTGMPPLQSGSPSLAGEDSINRGSLERQQETRARIAMDERHKRMVDDADKLLELITELKSDVDKSTKYETSAAAIKKAADIEKLAHDVRERMRN